MDSQAKRSNDETARQLILAGEAIEHARLVKPVPGMKMEMKMHWRRRKMRGGFSSSSS